MNNKLLTVSSSPHIKSPENTTMIMLDVLIALTPALVWACYIFGLRALTLTVIAILSSVLFEALYEFVMKKPQTTGDLSAVVTGVLIAFNLPVNAPLWLPVAGSAFAIVIVKQLFGGIGKNVVNPAIAARIFLFISFPSYMSSFFDVSKPKMSPFAIQPAFDAVAGATPLTQLKLGEFPSHDILDLFLGQHGGCIGEVSVVLLTAGGIYLIARRVISWHIPVAYLGTVALITFFAPLAINEVDFMARQMFSGGLFLGAFFMATDYVTSPVTRTGKLIFGAGCGLITIFIRYFGGYPEGVSFSIMIMNLFVWFIDKATKPVKFGGVSNAAKPEKK